MMTARMTCKQIQVLCLQSGANSRGNRTSVIFLKPRACNMDLTSPLQTLLLPCSTMIDRESARSLKRDMHVIKTKSMPCLLNDGEAPHN